MCLGHTHALSGAVAGLAVGLYLTHSTLAHCFGFLTMGFAWLIGKISGGHRHLTHAVLGVAGFEFLAWLAAKCRHEIGGKAGLTVNPVTLRWIPESIRPSRARRAMDSRIHTRFS